MFSFQGASSANKAVFHLPYSQMKPLNQTSLLAHAILSNRTFARRKRYLISLTKWRLRDSNSRPPACKAGALPTELHPHMGLSGLEPPTSRLSGVRSNQLSYKPILIWRPPTLPHRLQCSTIGRSKYCSVLREPFLSTIRAYSSAG